MRFPVALFITFAACSQPPLVVLFVEDASGEAYGAARVVVLRDDGHESSTPTEGKTFPFTVTVTSELGGTTASVWVEARTGEAVLARGRTRLEFPKRGGGRGTVRLFGACEGGVDGESCAVEAPIGDTGICVDGACGPSNCGDGFTDMANDEQCDDGNDDEQDACRSNCRSATCGDGITRADITNESDPDFEACDDGLLNADENPCTLNCRANVCGDGKLLAGTEPCEVDVSLLPVDYDNLDIVNTGDCIVVSEVGGARCVPASCGDGWVWDGAEACDHGGEAAACTSDCAAVPTCGNGIVEPDHGGGGEECDDGNDNPNDGCEACREVTWAASVVVGLPNGGGVPGDVKLTGPEFIVAAPDGVLYISVTNEDQVYRYDPRGAGGATLTPFAGTGVPGYSGDGGLARAAQLQVPRGLAIDHRGFLYVADVGNRAVRVIRTDGTIDTSHTITTTLTHDLAITSGGDLFYTSNQVHSVALDEQGIATGSGTTVPALANGTAMLAVSPAGVVYAARAATLTASPGGLIRNNPCSAEPSCGDGGPVSSAGFGALVGVAVDLDGNLYLSDAGLRRVRKIEAVDGMVTGDSAITTVAGTGLACEPSVEPGCGDGGPALDAALSAPRGIAVDYAGRLYVVDSALSRVRWFDTTVATPVIEALAGAGEPFEPPSSDPLHVSFPRPRTLAVEPVSGDILVGGPGDGRLRAIDRVANRVDVVAGSGLSCATSCGDGGLAVDAALGGITDVATDDAGRIYLCAAGKAYRIDLDATIHHIQGLGCDALTLDDDGNLYTAETNLAWIWRASAVGGVVPDTPVVTHFAGESCLPDCINLPNIDTPALNLPMGFPVDVVYLAGRLFVLDQEWNGIFDILILHSTGSLLTCDMSPDCDQPTAMGADGAGDLLLADGTWLRRYDTRNSLFSTVAGGATAETTGDRGPLAQASFTELADAVATSADEWFLLQADGFVRRAWNDAGTWMIDTIAGPVYPGDGPRTWATLDSPIAIAAQVGGTAADSWLLTDAGLGRVRRIAMGLDPADELVTVAGHPVPATVELAWGEEDPARVHRRLQEPHGVAFDAATDSVFVTEEKTHLLSRIDASSSDIESWTMGPCLGELGTSGHVDGAGDAARLAEPTGLALDAARRVLYLADTGNHVVRRVDLTGPPFVATAVTVLGVPGQAGLFAVDGAPATATHLDSPRALAVDASGVLFVADTGNNRVVRVEPGSSGAIEPTSLVSVVIGAGGQASSFGDGAPARALPVDSPRGVAIDEYGNLIVASRDTVRLVTPGNGVLADGNGSVLTLFGRGGGFLDGLADCMAGVAVTDLAATSDRIYVLDACQAVWFALDRQ